MPSPVRFPKLSRHKPSNRAYVVLRHADGGREYRYLGPWGSAGAKAEYAKVVAQLAANGGRLPPAADNFADLTVNELMVRFLDHARGHYRRADGTPTNEVEEYRQTFKPLKALFGSTPCRDFGPLALKAVRDAMVRAGLCRKLVNQRVGRVKRVFKWAVGEQIVSPMVHHALTAVAGLQANRTAARETAPVLPVEDAVVLETLPLLTRHVAGLVRFQRATGCRPGEACVARACDIDTAGDPWAYRPAHHKLAHRNKPRVIPIGPRGQEMVKEFAPADPTDYLFSPVRAVAECRAARAKKRVTKLYASHARRNAAKRVRKPKRAAGQRYTTGSYGRAILKAIDKENARRATRDGAAAKLIPHWHPNQIRHAVGTEVRKAFGLEAAQVLLGHTRADVTQVYAERDQALADRVAKEMG